MNRSIFENRIVGPQIKICSDTPPSPAVGCVLFGRSIYAAEYIEIGLFNGESNPDVDDRMKGRVHEPQFQQPGLSSHILSSIMGTQHELCPIYFAIPYPVLPAK